MANKTLIFTTTDVIKRARKIGRENQATYDIDKMTTEEFQSLSDEIDHLARVFFNLARTTKHPEQEFLGFAERGRQNANEKSTKLACTLIYKGAKEIIDSKTKELEGCKILKGAYDSEVLDWWRRYEKVREEGKFNMITEAWDAAEEAELTIDQYKYVIENYSDLRAAVIMDDALSEPAPF